MRRDGDTDTLRDDCVRTPREDDCLHAKERGLGGQAAAPSSAHDGAAEAPGTGFSNSEGLVRWFGSRRATNPFQCHGLFRWL